MKRNLVQTRHFVLTTLASSILLTQTVYALQELPDQALSQVNGQDGLAISTQYAQMDFDQLYWQDKAGTASGVEQALRATANGVKIRKNLAYNSGNYTLGTDYKIQATTTGSGSSSTAGLNFEIATMPSTISFKDFSICNQTLGTCDPSIGNLAIQTGDKLNIKFNTTNGLFDPNTQAGLTLALQNINIYAGLQKTANTYNQLILRNFNFNFDGKGAMYVDGTKGLILQTNLASAQPDPTQAAGKAGLNQASNGTYGYVDFGRVRIPNLTNTTTSTYSDSAGYATGSGLNIELMTKKEAYVDPTNPVYALTKGTNDIEAAKGLIRVGASGRMVNSYLQIRGINTNGATDNVLGYATAKTDTNANSSAYSTTTAAGGTIIGSSGIALRLRGEFTRAGDKMLNGDDTKATVLEIGGAGSNTFGFEFGDLTPLITNSNERAYFDSGNVYLNLANTRHLQMPVNTVLNTSRFGGVTGTNLTSNSDYIQQIYGGNTTTNPNSIVIAIRGADFQALSRRGRFTSSDGVSTANQILSTDGLNNKWGLGLPFYNLNSNIATYATNYTGNVYTLDNVTNKVSPTTVTNSQRLGLGLALSVQGRNTDGTKTTSILVIDAANNKNYYMGLRNIDMLLRGYGSMGFENGNVNVDMKDLLMVMAAEIAAGYLPKYTVDQDPTSAIQNRFDSKDDVLFGLKLKMLGDINFSLVPNNEISANKGNQLSIIGRYKLTDGTIQLSDPIQDSIMGLDRISGLVAFNNSIVINKDNVGFNYGFTINPDNNATDVLRIKDVNFYPPVNAPTGWDTSKPYDNRAQRLGEMVMTGGRITSEFTLKPRNQ